MKSCVKSLLVAGVLGAGTLSSMADVYINTSFDRYPRQPRVIYRESYYPAPVYYYSYPACRPYVERYERRSYNRHYRGHYRHERAEPRHHGRGHRRR